MRDVMTGTPLGDRSVTAQTSADQHAVSRTGISAGTVVVTGAAGAIGLAVADAFLTRGYQVVGLDVQSVVDVRPSSYRHVVADARELDELRDVAASLAGARLLHVIGVAGGALPEEIIATDVDDLDIGVFRRSLDLNLVSQYAMIRAFVPWLRAAASESQPAETPDRSITVISSVNALVGMDMPAYSAAKSGLIGMVRVLARMLGPEGIRVNAVAPGTVRTSRTERIWQDDPDHFERLEAQAPLGRLTTSAEVGRAVCGVALDLTATTGQVLVVDAGQSAVWKY